ncbi:MAG: PEP-CTERM sorting domain-containing protein [Akkermansiaceae bacterium]
MKHTLTIISTLCLSVTCSHGAISYVGAAVDTTTGTSAIPSSSATNEAYNWSNASVSKTYDIKGNDLYGTDGYAVFNTTGTGNAALSSLEESAPIFASGGVAAEMANSSGAFSNAGGSTGNILQASGTGNWRLGYAGFSGAANTAIGLTDLYSFTMTSDMAAGETLRFGVFGGSNNNDLRLDFTDLAVVAGGDTAVATGLNRGANLGNVADIYFFDITGLVTGDKIIIQAANSNASAGNNFNRATIGGATFDVVPEPSSTALLGLGGLALILRRRK